MTPRPGATDFPPMHQQKHRRSDRRKHPENRHENQRRTNQGPHRQRRHLGPKQRLGRTGRVLGNRGPFLPGEPGTVRINGDLIDKCAMALIKNAVENTPDGGLVTVSLKNLEGATELSVRDTGVGITAESQKQIFGGFYHARDTDFYTTKKPFDFGAGGKGLDLLRLRIFSETFGYQLDFQSKRCIYIPTETDVCQGDTTKCPHIEKNEQCSRSGGSTFTILFPSCPSSP